MEKIPTLESLLSFNVSQIQRHLRKEGTSLGDLDRYLRPGQTVSLFLSWKKKGWLAVEASTVAEIEVALQKDSLCLFMELRYRHREEGSISLRYDLVRKESNLKPGTFRYYIKDPYREGGLCCKLYFYPESRKFFSLSFLQSQGVRYAAQRKGKKDRYFTPVKVPDTRGRKSHYRGKMTPFWNKYEVLRDREEDRFIEYIVGEGWMSGIFPPEYYSLEREIKEDYLRHTGRKGRSRSRRTGE